jgi:hypothetical protein
MEPALEVIQRALQGEPGARAFLERTTSVYILDVTDSANPKTYGCWNYIHQALNEIERYEARQTAPVELVYHVRLLATMALRVARRSPLGDRALVTTCIENASEYHGSASQSDWLIELNLELREIVMGRIAAMAFDFNFHRRNGTINPSVFSDRVVLDTFCAILSANAVSSGPLAIQHFAREWIVPSARSIPPFAVTSVVFHLALEGARKSAPAGTKNTLQELSVPVISTVLTPALQEAISEDKDGVNAEFYDREVKIAVAAKGLASMQAWCDATDLSLPQIRHICNKSGVSFHCDD